MAINFLSRNPYEDLLEQDAILSGPEIYHDDEDYGANYSFRDDNDADTVQTLNETLPTDLKSMARAHLGNRKPVYDFKTKNESFVQVFKDLKTLGVKNNKFHLRLYDTELRGVDPFSPILPIELQMRIALECIVNPWYWLREICRIPADGAPIVVGGGSEFILDRNNVAAWYLFLNGIDHYASKPRQCGKTQNAVAQFDYAYHFGASSSTILFFNKDSALARTNLYRLKCQRDMMPRYLQMRMAFNEDGKIVKERDNITTMRNPINGNEIKTFSRATSSDSATRMGRGETAALQYYDEFDYEAFNIDIVQAAAPAYAKAADNAEANGAVHCRVFTSTPGDADHRDGKAANAFINKMLKWEERYFDEDINKLKKIVCDNDHNRVVFVEHTWKQLKKSMEWYETQCSLLNFKQEDILREIDLQRISGSSNSPFSREVLIYLTQNKREPINDVDLSDNYSPIYFYERIDPEYPYILSIDPAQALALDRTAMVLINPYTQKVAAEFRSPFIPFTKFAKMVVRFLDEYCPKAMVVVENNRGQELMDLLSETKYKYQIWFNEDSFGKVDVEKINKFGVQQRDAVMRRYAGFSTNSTTRPLLFNLLDSMVEDRIDDIYTQYVVEEITTLVRKTPTRIEAAPDAHDDVLFAYLIGLFVYFNASNLEDYGIRRGAKEPHITTEDDPKTVTQKMLQLLGNLPNDYKAMFLKAIGKDPAAESNRYAAEVQAASRRKKRELGIKDEKMQDNAYMNPDGDAWKQMDDYIWNSNDMNKIHVAHQNNDPLAGYDMFGGYGFGSDPYQGSGSSGTTDLDDFFNSL